MSAVGVGTFNSRPLRVTSPTMDSSSGGFLDDLHHPIAHSAVAQYQSSPDKTNQTCLGQFPPLPYHHEEIEQPVSGRFRLRRIPCDGFQNLAHRGNLARHLR